MKTRVKITQDQHQSTFKKDDIGYIDGYIKAMDGRPYAVVIVGSIIDFVPIWNLEVISE